MSAHVVPVSQDAVEQMIASRAPQERFQALTRESEIADGYRRLISAGGASRLGTSARSAPLASIVVSYFALPDHVKETVTSLATQMYEPLELIVINDGSFEPEDEVLDVLERAPYGATLLIQENCGAVAARNKVRAATSCRSTRALCSTPRSSLAASRCSNGIPPSPIANRRFSDRDSG